MKAKLFALALASMPLVGCASSGTDFNTAALSSLQPGVSTRADAERLLGPANTVITMPDGSSMVSWVHVAIVMGSSESKAVMLTFDREGKFVRVMSQTQTSM